MNKITYIKLLFISVFVSQRIYAMKEEFNLLDNNNKHKQKNFHLSSFETIKNSFDFKSAFLLLLSSFVLGKNIFQSIRYGSSLYLKVLLHYYFYFPFY